MHHLLRFFRIGYLIPVPLMILGLANYAPLTIPSLVLEPSKTVLASTELSETVHRPAEESRSPTSLFSAYLVTPVSTGGIVLPAITESSILTLEYPLRMRRGDSDVIRLSLEMETPGNLTRAARFTSKEKLGESLGLPDLENSYRLIAEARLDLAGVEVRPSDTVIEPLLPGQSVIFYWMIKPSSPGNYRGTAWLHIRFVNNATGEDIEKVISAQILEIEVVDLLGSSANRIRSTGIVSFVLGGFLSFPFFKDIFNNLLKTGRSKNYQS